MPKDDILGAMQFVLREVKGDPDLSSLSVDDTYVEMNSPAITAKTSKEAVNLPKSGKGPAHWGFGSDKNRINLTFKQMINILEFSLDNAFFTLGGN